MGLLTSLLTVGAVLLAGPGALGITGLGIISASTAYAMAITFGVSTLASRIFAPNVPQVQDNGVRQQVPPDTSTGVPIVYGEAFLGGKFCDAVLSTNQQVMWYTMAISCVSPNGTFTFDKTKFYYGDQLITFDTVEPARVVSLTDGAGNVNTKINGQLFIYLYRSTDAGVITNLDNGGTSSGSGLPNTIISTANGAPSGQEWSATNRQMNGLAFAIVKLIYSRDANTTSFSPITFHCKQTLNGQSVAKPGDVWLDYMTNATYGGAVPSAFVDSNSATALNSYSDQLITFNDYNGNPTTQPRYRINGVLDTGQTALSNVDKIMIACDSWMQYNAASGKWAVVINKAESSALSFDDSNIVGSLSVGSIDITQTINQIEAKFNDKTNRDQANYVNEKIPSGLLYPNEPVNKYTITYDLVNDSVQALYLANRILEQAREDLTVTINTTYVGIQVNAGDVVSVTNNSYGWTNKLFRVMKVQEASLPDGNLGASLNLIEYNSAIYDDKDVTQYAPAPNNELASPTYFSGLLPPTVTASYPSATVPTFDVQVTMPTVGRVTFIRLFYSTYSSPTPSQWKLLDSYTTANSQPITNGSTYTFDSLSLPSGSYYFGVLVGNEISQSAISVPSFLFTWSPSGTAGPTGPRTATGYVYYTLASQTAPSAPTLSSYNFDTGTFGSISANWTTTFNAPDPVTNPSTEAGSKFWAVRYYVTETTYGGSQSITTSSPFNWTNLDGLVTFTNITTNSGTTFIDGGNIKAATITVDRLIAGILIGYQLRTGSGHTPNGYAFEVSSSGVVFADNVVGGIFMADNYYYNAQAIYGATNRNYEGVIGLCAASNSGTAAHGIRGINYNRGTSGLVGPANSYDFYADGSGTNYGPFTGTHDSLVPIGTTYEVGDIVIDTEIIARNGISSTIALVTGSTQANQPAVLGVVCQEPKSLLDAKPAVYIIGFDQKTNTPILSPQYETDAEIYNLMPVNAVGEGQINVCGEGGDIQAGDLIVTSSIAGKGMKQADDIVRNITVAKAREAITFSSPNEIKTIACIYLCG